MLSITGEAGQEMQLMLEAEGMENREWQPLWNEVQRDLRERLGPSVKFDAEVVDRSPMERSN